MAWECVSSTAPPAATISGNTNASGSFSFRCFRTCASKHPERQAHERRHSMLKDLWIGPTCTESFPTNRPAFGVRLQKNKDWQSRLATRANIPPMAPCQCAPARRAIPLPERPSPSNDGSIPTQSSLLTIREVSGYPSMLYAKALSFGSTPLTDSPVSLAASATYLYVRRGTVGLKRW